MADPSQPLIHNITVEGGWDGVPDHAVNLNISIDVTGVPSTQLSLLSCDDPLIESINVLSVYSLETDYESIPLSTAAAPPAPDNSPMTHRGSIRKEAPLIGDEYSVADSPKTSPSKSPRKSLYVRGMGIPQSVTRRRLFPHSPEAAVREVTQALGEQHGWEELPEVRDIGVPRGIAEHQLQTFRSIRPGGHESNWEGNDHHQIEKVLGDLTNSVSKHNERFPRTSSSSSTYLDIPTVEMDSEGILHVPFPGRQRSNETVNISLSSRTSSMESEKDKEQYTQLNPLARIFSPVVEEYDLMISKKDGRAFGDNAENRSFKAKASLSADREADESSQVSASEGTVAGSPSKFRLRQIPTRISSKIPIKSPKKPESPEQSVKPPWRYPGAEDILAQDRQSISPTKVTTPPAPLSPDNRSTPKNKQHSPAQSPTKNALPVTPQKQKLGTKSLENMHVPNTMGGGSPQKPHTLKRIAMTVGRVEGSRGLIERDRDVTIKVNRFNSPPKPDLHISIPQWLEDRKDCVGLGLTPPLTTESQAGFLVRAQSSDTTEPTYGLDSGDSASNWDPIFDQPQNSFHVDTSDETTVLPSPTPSSQMDIPWTSTKQLVSQEVYSEFLNTMSDFSPDSPSWLHSLRRILPSCDEVDGRLSVIFPCTYNSGTCRIVISANIFAGKKGPGGWHALTIPGLPTQEAEWGSVSLRIAGDDDPSPVQFKDQGLIDPKIEPECISGFFDSTHPLQIDVRFKEEVHKLEKFEVDSGIQAHYVFEEDHGLWVYYTGSCKLRDFDENVAADTCQFALFVCNGPPGTMIHALEAGKRNVYFEKEGLIEVGNPPGGMRVSLMCPTKDIRNPFTLTWMAYLGVPPISVAIPKIRAHPMASFEDDEGGHRLLHKTMLIRLREDMGSPFGQFRVSDTWPPKLRSGLGGEQRQVVVESWDIDIGPGPTEPVLEVGHAEVQTALEEHEQDHSPVQNLNSPSGRKPRGKKVNKPRSQRKHRRVPSRLTRMVDKTGKLEATPESLEHHSSTGWDNKRDEGDPHWKRIVDTLQDMLADVVNDPIYAPVDIIGGLIHISVKLLTKGLAFFSGLLHTIWKLLITGVVIFVDSFLPGQRGPRGVAELLKTILRFVFIVCMIPILNIATEKAAVMVRDEWNGKTDYLGQGKEVAKDVITWVMDKKDPLIKMGKEGEMYVKTLVDGILPEDDLPWVVEGRDAGRIEQKVVEDQGKRVTATPTEIQPTPTPSLRDYLDWAMGWRGPIVD